MENYLKLFTEATIAWLPRIGGAVLMLLIFWLLVRLVSGIIRRIATRLELDESLAMLLLRSIRVGLWTFGLTGFALGFT